MDPLDQVKTNEDVMSVWGPEPADGVRKYVEYVGRGQGVGYGRAKRFIEFFGHEKLPAIIKSNPQLLLQAVPRLDYRGLSLKWNQRSEEEHEAMMALLSFRNVHIGEAKAICDKYGFKEGSRTIWKQPYKLSMEVEGIGFEKADRIAAEIGIKRDSPERAYAALYFALQECMSDGGDSYVKRREWMSKAEWLIGRRHSKTIGTMISKIVEEGHVYEVILPKTTTKPGEHVFYPKSQYQAETRLARKLREISKAEIRPIQDVSVRIEQYEKKHDIQLSDMQKRAIKLTALNPLLTITGGPGTGKTTVVKALVEIFGEDHGMPMSLAAFAGCAAKRLRDASKAPATTIHKLLSFDPMVGSFSFNEDNPLDSEIVILDECSMIDVSLFDVVTRAVAIGTRLVLIGDVDQLPSIGSGAALRDIIRSEIAPTIYLDTIFRQRGESQIVANAKRVLRGEIPVPAVKLNDKIEIIDRSPDETSPRDYVDLEVRSPEEKDPDHPFDMGDAICETVVRLVKEISKRYRLDPKSIQVLSPMRVKAAGADALNKSLQQALNPLSKTKKSPFKIGVGEDVAVGDKVMQQRNDYGKGLYNGDVGMVTFTGEKEMLVDFIDADVPKCAIHSGPPASMETLGYCTCRKYTRADAKDIRIAYASSIHKSQGSEYPCVVLVVTSAQRHMFERNGKNMLYTAITRGKDLVFVVHDPGAIEKSIREPSPRQTLLAERLQGVPIQYYAGSKTVQARS